MPFSYNRGVRGADEIRRNLAKLMKNLPQEVGRSAKREFEIEKKESMRRTPVKTGRLRDSHYVGEPEIANGIIRVEIGAGNEETRAYDVIQHEDLELHHEHGQAKFLESTLMESARFMAGRIADGVDLRRVIE